MPQINNQQGWGEQLATVFQSNYPNLANAVRPGLAADCSGFMPNIEANPALKSQLEAICDSLEGAMQYLINKNDADCAALQKQLNDKSALVDRLSAALLLHGTRGSTGNARRVSEDPEKFSGMEKDIAKRQQQYVNWRSQINRCFGVDRDVFNTEYRKIQHISGLLKDDAYDMNRDHFDTVTEHPDDPEYWHWKTAAQVFKALNIQYETLDLSQQASQAFDNLWMTNKPFQNFLADFNRLAAKCGKTQEQKVEALRLKVSQELSDEIAHRGDRPGKADFAKWAEMCQQIYNNLEEQKHVDRLRNSRLNPNRQQPRSTSHAQRPESSPPAPTSDPMVLDVTRLRPTREQCMQHGLCFYCKKPGHSKDECEEKKRADTRWSGQHWNSQGLGHSQLPPRNQAYGRGHMYGRGRGQAQNPFHSYQHPSSPALGPQPQHNGHFAQAPYNRLRALEPGFVEEMSSSSPSPSFIGTPDLTSESESSQQMQGKE
jgi:hypothetical protein